MMTYFDNELHSIFGTDKVNQKEKSATLSENRQKAPHSGPGVVHHILLCEAPEARRTASDDRDSIKVTAQPGTKDTPPNKGEFNHLTPF